MKKANLKNVKKLELNKTAIAKLSMSHSEMRMMFGGVTVNVSDSCQPSYSVDQLFGDCITKSNRPTSNCPENLSL